MKNTQADPDVNAVEMMRAIRSQLEQEVADLSFVEQKKRIAKEIEPLLAKKPYKKASSSPAHSALRDL